MEDKNLITTSPEQAEGWHEETWVYRGRRLNRDNGVYLEFQRISEVGSLVGPEFGYPQQGMPRGMQVGQLVRVYTNGARLRIGGENAPRLTTSAWFVDEREKWVAEWQTRDAAALTQQAIVREAKKQAKATKASRTIADVKAAYDNCGTRAERAAIIASLIEEVTHG